MTATVTAFLDRARFYLGAPTVERPPGSNCCAISAKFDGICSAWCCKSISVWTAEAFGRRILWTAGVAEAIRQARAGVNAMKWHPKGAGAQPGFAMVFDFGPIHGVHGDPQYFHISAVEAVRPATRITIGGNEHDRVMRQERDETYCQGYIEFPFGQPVPVPGPPPPAPASEEDDMIRIPAPGPNSRKGADGKPYEHGTVILEPGRKGSVIASADGFPEPGAAIRMAIGTTLAPPFPIKDNTSVTGQRTGWKIPTDHNPPPEVAACTNYGPMPVTVTVEYD